MTEITISSAIPESMLAALAVLGAADEAMLSALLDGQTTPLDTTILDQQAAVEYRDGMWRLSPTDAAAILANLEQQAPIVYRTLHEKALTYLADCLRKGNTTVEPGFLLVFDRLASYLVPHDPQVFEALITAVQTVPLSTGFGQQTRAYFQGLARFKLGHHQEALLLFNTLLATPALAPQIRARTLNARAYCHNLLGQFEEAVQGYRTSLTLWRQLDDRLNEGKVLLNLGIMAYGLQQYAETEAYLVEAERCFNEAGSAQMVASVQNELGLVCRDQGRWADALHYLQASADQARAEGATDALSAELNNIGEVLLFQGRIAEAATAFQEALVTIQTRANLVDVYLNLGLVHQVNQDLPNAQSAFQAALDLAHEIDRRDILAEIHFRLGEALRRQGEDAQALTQFEAAAQVVEATREPIREEGLKISLLGRWQQIYETLVLHCLHLGRAAEAWQWSERARARAFAEQMTSPQSTSPPDPLSVVAEVGAAALRQPERGNMVDDKGVSLAEIQARLPVDTLLLNYFTTGVFDHHAPFWRALGAENPLRTHVLTPARTLLFAITRDRVSVHVCPVDPNAFASASRRHEDRSRFLAPKLLAQFSKMLLPLELPAQMQRLIIIPHGPLHHVPFAALTVSTDQPLLAAGGLSLAYAPSATILHQQQSRPQEFSRGEQICLAVGYDGGAEHRLLRHTEREAQFIAELTRGVAWTGATPKKTQLRDAAQTCRWLHIACHGWFDYETPLASYLETGHGEQLSAEEVLRTWHLHAELVTLSACQTGVHRLLRSDEPMGLIRGFLAAGARTVLASQWPVEDLPTFLLMQRFYRQLVDEAAADPAAALRDAQVWLRRLTLAELARLPLNVLSSFAPADDAPTQPFADPRHWAGFVIFGHL